MELNPCPNCNGPSKIVQLGYTFRQFRNDNHIRCPGDKTVIDISKYRFCLPVPEIMGVQGQRIGIYTHHNCSFLCWNRPGKKGCHHENKSETEDPLHNSSHLSSSFKSISSPFRVNFKNLPPPVRNFTIFSGSERPFPASFCLCQV